jgi:cytochrome c556
MRVANNIQEEHQMRLRQLWSVKTLLATLGIAIVLVAMSACTSTPTTVTTTVTTTPPAVTVTATPQANPNLDALKQLAGPPPSSLDQYFPPKAPAPLYLIEMFTLAGPFEGIGVDLQEGDMANVKLNYQAFVTEYAKISKMVLEWTSQFPQAPLDALGAAINSGNPAQIGQAMGGVGNVCSSCHLVNQVKVQQQYHWKNFDDVKVTDPISGKSLAWVDYMTAMGGAFEGSIVDLQEGQLDNARKNFQAFTTQYKALATDGCKQCHSDPVTGKEIPRQYYVDAASMALIDQMGQALSATPPDATAVGNLNGAIGNSLCLGCHLVHLPAQVAKDSWSQNSALFK